MSPSALWKTIPSRLLDNWTVQGLSGIISPISRKKVFIKDSACFQGGLAFNTQCPDGYTTSGTWGVIIMPSGTVFNFFCYGRDYVRPYHPDYLGPAKTNRCL